MTWYSEYKCRLCGKIYRGGAVTGAKDIAMEVVWFNAGVDLKRPAMCPKPQSTHFCKDGSFGLADFIGMKAEKEKDNET